MKHHHHIATHEAPTMQGYVMGFVISLVLTFTAFGLAFAHMHSEHSVISHQFLKFMIVVLALAQLVVQTVFFLHLSRRSHARFNLVAFVFTIYTVAFIVIGSLWIMDNLNQNMSTEQIGAYLHHEN